MTVDLRKFFQVTNPSKTLVAGNPEDQKYYIDFSEVRGGEIVRDLKENIAVWSPEQPTCVLFTGHIGCGKSTELLRLKAELEQEGFHVVYFESSEDLELADVDIADVMLAIAKRISESLEQSQIDSQAGGFRALLDNTMKVLRTEIDIKASANFLGNKVGVDSQKREVSLSAGIAELTVVAKNDQGLRERLNQYLGPQKNKLLEAINQELIVPAIDQLKQRGKQGLVVIVDNLDRIDNRPKSFGRPQQEYLFIDQSECLSRLSCHVVYTMPLALKFSNEYGTLTQRYEEPKVLPMVPVQLRDGGCCEAGLALLRQMVLARAFPELTPEERLEQIPALFAPDTLDRLCCVSGGHVRDLLRLLNDWIKKGRQAPLSVAALEDVISARRNEMMMPISDEEWALLRQVKQRKKVSGDQDYQTLIRSRLVFEYRDAAGSWFEVNPILAEAPELQV